MNEFNSLDEKFNEIKDLINISIELGEEEELESQHISLVNIDAEIDSLETKKYFSKKHDRIGLKCFLECIPGGLRTWILQ